MKKLVTILVCSLWSSMFMASAFGLTIDKTKVDIGKNENINVTFTKNPSFDNATYKVYIKDGEVYLDLDSYGGEEFLSERLAYSIPINLRTLLNGYELEEEVTLHVRLLDDYTGLIRGQKTFKLNVFNSLGQHSYLALGDLSGLWYKPSQSGVGFVVMQVADITTIQYYGYDRHGKPLWLMSDNIAGAWGRDKEKSIDLYEANPDAGTDFTHSPTGNVKSVNWGKLTLKFKSCSEATATLDGKDGWHTIKLTRLAYATSSTCIDYGGYKNSFKTP